MVKKWLRALLCIVGIPAGVALALAAFNVVADFREITVKELMPYGWRLVILILAGLAGGFLTFFIGKILVAFAENVFYKWEKQLGPLDLKGRLVVVGGALIGLLAAYLICDLFRDLEPWLNIPLSVLFYFLFGYIGLRIAWQRRNDPWLKAKKGAATDEETAPATGKLLDTSVIIDGRIYDIIQTGFMEGPLVVPNFVIQELQHIADSADLLKRNRGRRGLDVLNRIRKETGIQVIVDDTDYKDLQEVDQKLLRLAQDKKAAIVTNDYNLNKVAGVHAVQVLNINELANAVKPVVLPGEEMHISVIREGKEPGQGVGYLEDGTMVVVDGARPFIGEEIDLVVTSALQTAAGRMIFGRLQTAQEDGE